MYIFAQIALYISRKCKAEIELPRYLYHYNVIYLPHQMSLVGI